MNGVQTRLKCKPNVKRCKRFVFAAHSPLLHPNTLKTKAIIHFQTDHILTRFVFPPLHETSTGLISFVDSYRKFSALQKPSPEPFYLKELLLQVKSIHLIPSHIQLTLQIEPDDLMLYADPNLIRQVLINLLKNATQAIGENKGKIHIRAYSTKEEHILVYVSNDGPAIPEKEAEEIFVPFFTTKKEGSGIGLSLSRQIMKLSNGSISLLKAETNGWNTTFVLEFF